MSQIFYVDLGLGNFHDLPNPNYQSIKVMSSEICVPYRFNAWNLRTSVCLLVIWTWIGGGRWYSWFTLHCDLSEVNRGHQRSMTFDDVICHFSGFCAPRGNLVRWFWTWHPFAIHMCRNRVIGAIKYSKEKWQFLRKKIFLWILAPKSGS